MIGKKVQEQEGLQYLRDHNFKKTLIVFAVILISIITFDYDRMYRKKEPVFAYKFIETFTNSDGGKYYRPTAIGLGYMVRYFKFEDHIEIEDIYILYVVKVYNNFPAG